MNYQKKTVRDIDVKGKKVLLRCDFNVPQDKKTGAITSDKRIVAALPTIRYLLDYYLSFQIVAILLHFFKVYVGDFLVFSAIVRLTGIRVTLRTLLCTALLLLSLSVVHFL